MIERTVNVTEEDAVEVSDVVTPNPPRHGGGWQARSTRPLFYRWTRFEKFKSRVLGSVAAFLHRIAYRLQEYAWPGKRRGPDRLP